MSSAGDRIIFEVYNSSRYWILRERKPPHDINEVCEWSTVRMTQHRVSDNLYLQVRPSRKGGLRASRILRYYRDGRQTWRGLGKASVFALAEARERARKHRQLLADGFDPLAVKRQKITGDKIEAAKSLTFGECARKYVAAHESSWKNGKHAAQ